MEYLIISCVAFLTSLLTLFSGFGLGTLLMPVFALFFPINIAIVLTGIVHLFNNIFKLIIFRKYAKKEIIIKFGIPAFFLSIFGAMVLNWLSILKPLFCYELFSYSFCIIPIKLIISLLLILFLFFEIIPYLANIKFHEKYLPLGGAFSGFLGGLSGHQGALRSAFLIRCNLSKESFIGTGVVIACMVDLSRLFIYINKLPNALMHDYFLIGLAIGFAFLGTLFGNKLFKKVTYKVLQKIVSIMLFIFAICLGCGII